MRGHGTGRPKTVIAGSGIIGALCAFRLAEAGADVTVLEARERPGSLVTAASFGWINAISYDPGDDAEIFALRCRAFEAFAELERALGRPLPAERRGAMLWKRSMAETEAAAHFFLAAGGEGQLIDGAEIERRVPGIIERPDCALFSEREFALDVTALTEMLLTAATERGARLITGCPALAIETGSGKLTGVRTADGIIPAERLVVAAGAESRTLLKGFDVACRIETSPAAIVALNGSFNAPTPIADGPDLEFRVQSRGRLLSAWGVSDEPNPEAVLAEKALRRVRKTLGEKTVPEVAFVRIGQRPTSSDGHPLVGPVAGADGAFVAVVHPGVILGPAVAETLRDLILGIAPSSGIRATSV